MLVLSRKVGERIVLPGCQVTLTVLEAHGSHIRLGISAPAGVAVHREEVWRRLKEFAAAAPGFHERGRGTAGGRVPTGRTATWFQQGKGTP
jgi:carbon storage regulator